MTDEVEHYSRRRRRLLVFMACAFIIWQVAGLPMFDDIAAGDRRLVRLVGLLAFAFWAGVLLWLVAGKALRGASAGAQRALNDELVRANRAKSFAVGYWIMLVAAAIAFTLSLFVPVRANEAAQLILVTGVVAPMFAFAWLEGRGG